MASTSKQCDFDDNEAAGISRSGRVRKKSIKLTYLDTSNKVGKNKKKKKKKSSKKHKSKNKSNSEEKENNKCAEIVTSVDNPIIIPKRNVMQQKYLSDCQPVEKKIKMDSPSAFSAQTHSESETDSALSNDAIGTPDYTSYDEDSKDSDDELLFPNLRMTHQEPIKPAPLTVATVERETTFLKTPLYTGYKLWSSEMKKEILNKYPDIDMSIMTVRLGEMWTQLSVKDRNNWHNQAQRLSEKNTSQKKLVTDCDKKDWLSTCNKKRSKILPPSNEENLRTIDIQPIDVAAHLKLLGESLMLIGTNLEQRERPVVTSDCMTVLLDSLLCAMGSLICLTQQVPFTKLDNRLAFLSTLENMTYIMPGL